MPARPVRHLDLLLVPAQPAQVLDELLAELAHMGVCGDDGRAGPQAELLVQGGFERLTVDRPKGAVLYANRQGGFSVFCPSCHALATGPFVRALQGYRAGGERRMVCAACAGSFDLDLLDFRPPAAFGQGALIIEDAQTGWLTDHALGLVTSIVGAVRVVGRRR